MKHFLHTVFIFIFSISILSAQGIIVNEVSNGPSGTSGTPLEQEYIELVVIGSESSPTGSVDLTGWVIDDNNGDFTGNQTGVGIASGHLRITSNCLSNVVPGTIIVIYNEADRNPSLPADDLTDSNNDCVYIIPANSSCIESCSTIPNSSGTSTYSGCTYGTGLFVNMGIANAGDAVQTRRPDFSFYHGFCFGTNMDDHTTGGLVPNFPSDLGGGSSFKIFSGSGADKNYFFENGDFTNVNHYDRGNADPNNPPVNETPGAPNSDLNRAFINAVRNGNYDYSDLSANSPTTTATTLSGCINLPVYLSAFEGEKMGKQVKLDWIVESTTNEYFTFEIERSATGYNFEKIDELGGYDYERFYSYIVLYMIIF